MNAGAVTAARSRNSLGLKTGSMVVRVNVGASVM
jgi:hypothetical protein